MSAPLDLDPTEVVIGTANGPGLWVAPEGTAPPAPGEPFAAPWLSLGYTSDDGVTVGGDKTTETITPWQSTAPIRTIITEVTRTVAFVLWQLNQTTLGMYFDTPVADTTPDAEGVVNFDVSSSGGGLIYAVAVDARDGENCLRLIWSRANLDSTGDMQLTKGAAVPLDVTLSALDNGGSQVTVQMFPASLLSGGGGATAATGATAGTPGTFTPAGSTQPATGAAIATLTASPNTAWTTGEYVVAVNADERYWDGSAWQTGQAV